MDRLAGHLPKHFPVGTRYVVEGRGGGDGQLLIRLRYIEFPDGRQVNLPVPAKNWNRTPRAARGKSGTRKK
jgi:hypothetical protein